jgi:hypothetical protein
MLAPVANVTVELSPVNESSLIAPCTETKCIISISAPFAGAVEKVTVEPLVL